MQRLIMLYDITYEVQTDETYFKVNVDRIRNPFDIDYTVNAETNMMFNEMEVSSLRNMKLEYKKYALILNGNEYPVNYLYPTTNDSTTLKLIVDGNPFGGNAISYDYIVIRPNNYEVNRVFNLKFDPVENFRFGPKITSRRQSLCLLNLSAHFHFRLSIFFLVVWEQLEREGQSIFLLGFQN